MARKLKDYASVILRIEDFDGRIDFAAVFGRQGAVHIEIGSGKAGFLLNEAMAQPDANFLGIERARKYYRYGVDRIGRWALTNVRIVRTDAAEFLARFVGDESVECFHVYFPDPWPKRRQHKRRFFCQANLDEVVRTLRGGGIINIATDYEEYFREIRDLLLCNEERLEPAQFVRPAGARNGEAVGTNYERKYRKDNRTIYTIAARKI